MYENYENYDTIISMLCPKCGRVLIKTLPSNDLSSVGYFCLHCNEYFIK